MTQPSDLTKPMEAQTIPTATYDDGIPFPLEETGAAITPVVNRFVGQTYLMVGGLLLVTALGAFVVMVLPPIIQDALFVPALLLQLVMAFTLGFIRKRSGTLQLALASLLALAEGVALGVITSIVSPMAMLLAALPAAGTMAVMGVYGMYAKQSVLTWRTQLFTGLICMLLLSLMGVFFSFGPLEWLFCVAGIALFAGLTAYDTRMIREQAMIGFRDPDRRLAAMVQGATGLYLDFINLLMFFLRLLGGRK